jgi:hypothetical protein
LGTQKESSPSNVRPIFLSLDLGISLNSSTISGQVEGSNVCQAIEKLRDLIYSCCRTAFFKQKAGAKHSPRFTPLAPWRCMSPDMLHHKRHVSLPTNPGKDGCENEKMLTQH